MMFLVEKKVKNIEGIPAKEALAKPADVEATRDAKSPAGSTEAKPSVDREETRPTEEKDTGNVEAKNTAKVEEKDMIEKADEPADKAQETDTKPAAGPST